MEPFDDLDRAGAFHGHLGPNLVIGIKMGNRAIAALDPERCFELRAEVYCPARPPVSCVIDGIQLSTGCTMGKANISHIPRDKPVEAVFTNTATGRSIALRVVDGFVEQAASWIEQLGETEASLRTWNTEDERVFAVRE